MHEIIHLINEMSPYLLLGFLLAGVMHAFLPANYIGKYMSGRSFRSVINAAIFGIPLPLCSCGVIPTAMSLRKEGASHGAVVSFLVATPQTGVDSIIATYSLMGLPFALIRPLAALATALFGGAMVNWGNGSCAVPATTETEHEHCDCHEDHCDCHEEHEHHHHGHHDHAHHDNCSCCDPHHEPAKTFWGKVKEALIYAYIEMMEDIGKWLVIGLFVAGLITVLVPDSLFGVFQGNTFASMLLVLCIALPMYLCATGSIPIAVALMMKGLTPGAALVLLMAGPACNFASMLVVRKVLGLRTLVIYLVSIVIGAIAFGCLIDYLQFSGTVDFLEHLTYEQSCCSEGDGWFPWACTILLILLLVNALFLNKHHHHHHHETETTEINSSTMNNVTIYHVEGMNCNHCRMAAEKALQSVPGVTSASVDLASKEAKVEGEVSFDVLAKAIEEIGFQLKA